MAVSSNQRLRWAVGMAITTSLAALATLFLTSAGAARQPADGAPIALCSWTLVDVGTDTFAAGPDADPAVPSAPGVPCSFNTETASVDQPDGVDEMIHVRPDTDAATRLQSFLVVAQPVGGDPAAAVTATVTGPDGAAIGGDAQLVDCGGDPIHPAFTGASSLDGSGALAVDAITRDDGRGLADRCRQGDVDLWGIAWDVDASMPCGTYDVTLTASSASGVASMAHGIEVVCFWWLTIDFDDVNWDVQPGNADTVVGDTDPATPDAPTVTNAGNAPLQVGVELSPLSLPDGSASIDAFSGAVDGDNRAIPADEVTWFDPDLCPTDSAALDLTVLVDSATPPGDYSGQYTVWGRDAVDSGCSGQGAP